ncbi:MAG: ergothioneine biosynthesis protein EgtC [Leptolyngbyaceae bacterium]|nr:ergothioneine biosynthesis protein EgtC [Leptolyngbyaceae bacterium]
MCRLLGYLGSPIQLDSLLYQPDHSLIAQSYQPREMTAGLLNADGFGVGWYHAEREVEPFTYKNTLPIWNDVNLPQVSRYVESRCVLASVRSATPGLAVDLTNCQPFRWGQILGIHNGYIENFRRTLCRPIRTQLSEMAYQVIEGTTDSEHIFALLIDIWQTTATTLEQALHKTLITLADLAQEYEVTLSANIVISDGTQMVASRFANRCQTPSLYWLQEDSKLSQGIAIASEPLFSGNWVSFPERSILSVGPDLKIKIEQF